MNDLTRVFDEHGSFVPRDTGDGYRVEDAVFEATVVPGGRRTHLICELPTIDAVVVGETVAEVVQDGWFETLERRLADPGGAVVSEDVDLTVTQIDDRVLVEAAFGDEDPAGDALAIVAFVEGTWFQGIVPGYEYTDRVQAQREAARARGRR